MLGGFTTYSAAVAATVELAEDGALASGGYLALSLLASILAAALGLALGESVRRRRRAAGHASGSPEELAP